MESVLLYLREDGKPLDVGATGQTNVELPGGEGFRVDGAAIEGKTLLRSSADKEKSSPQITVNRPNESSSIVPTTQVNRMILRALRKLGNGRSRRKP